MSTDKTPDRQLQLAEERTDIAYQRTQLAEERTFSAWIRTGLASVATGFAIAKLMSGAGPSWLIRLLGALFIVVGSLMFGLAFHAYRGAIRRMQQASSTGISVWVSGVIAVLLLLGAGVALVLVFLE